MSNRYRNPFKIRATEKLESENNFLRMYSPLVLQELLEKNKIDKLWNNILFIRSSPGAGKTSMLKIFEPNSLLTLSNNKSAPDYSDIVEFLKRLEVFDANGKIFLTGVYMSCARNYEVIEDLDIPDGLKKNLFFALFNARIILSSLRSIVNLNSNVELNDIELHASSFDYSYLDIKFPVNGTQLFNWAATIEKSVFKLLDSFLPIATEIPSGGSELFAFDLINTSNIIINNKKYEGKMLFMFDDAHKLSKSQRNLLLKYLIDKRAHCNIWIAERIEALNEEESFSSYKERDYDEINLEEIWQQGTTKLKTIVANIAERRASMSSEDVKYFQDFLGENIKELDYEDKFLKVCDQSKNNIKAIASFTQKFDNWINYLTERCKQGISLENAVLCRQVEILVQRSLGKTQLTFEFPYSVEELEQKFSSELRGTALYLLSIEHKIPYYYGFDNLVKLSSNNIEQFLSFASELFELMLAQKISDQSPNVDAIAQEKLLKKIADNKWKEQERLISSSALNFLQNLALFSQKETNKPNAPYAPGISGFAIKELNENRLINSRPWLEDDVYKPLVKVLKICLSYNLLEKRYTKQGKENQQWTVFYLNRWICLRFNLPFSYGGFRHKTPVELLKWTK